MNGKLSRAPDYNGRNSWVDETNTFAIWYDGQRGEFFDWMFGYAKRIGSSSEHNALMFSDEETTCPQDVTRWKNDNSAKLSCISKTTTDVPTEGSGNFRSSSDFNMQEVIVDFDAYYTNHTTTTTTTTTTATVFTTTTYDGPEYGSYSSYNSSLTN